MNRSMPRVLIAMLLAGAVVFPLQADTTSDFTGGTGTPYVLTRETGSNAAAVPGGQTFLRLVHGTDPNERNTVTFDVSDANRFNTVTATFDFRITPGTGRGEGLGFALLDTAFFPAGGVVGDQEPAFAGSLGIGFDTAANGGEPGNNHVSVHFDRILLTQIQIDPLTLDLADGGWIQATVEMRAGDATPNVTITLQQGATTVVPVSAFAVPGLTPYAARAWFGAENAGTAADHDLENVQVAFAGDAGPAPVPGPEITGQWSSVKNLPVVGIHTASLPNGKVVFWDRFVSGDKAEATNPRLWDVPADPNLDTPGISVTKTPHPVYEIFCAGHSFLRDGRLFTAGGHNMGDGYGLNRSFIYDPTANTWTEKAFFAQGRWYPTNTTLSDGNVLVVSGSITPGNNNQLPQVYLAETDTWRDLDGAVRGLPLYPMMHLAPDGRVFMSGPNKRTEFIDPQFVDGGTGQRGKWEILGDTSSGLNRSYGTSVLYDTGKVLLIGGGQQPPTPTCESIDLTAGTPSWTPAAPLHYPRRQLCGLILADGKILVTGGTSGRGFNNFSGHVLASEIWDPATGLWTLGAFMNTHRLYHSETVLLPDGRVLSIGGGHPSGTHGGANQFNAEIYSPPYLFKGPRPVISAAPSRAAHGWTMRIDTPDPGSIANVHLIRLSAMTHSFNMAQRIARLVPTAVAGAVEATVPASPSVVPPGPYMLFLVDSNGVPSVASMTLIDNTAPVADAGPPQSVDITSPTGTDVTVDASASSDPEGNIVTYEWYEGGMLIHTAGQPVTTFQLTGTGAHLLTVRVIDSLGLYAESTVTVTLTDPNAPLIQSLAADQWVLRPADGTVETVTITGTAIDNADPSPTLSILSISSSEPDSGVVPGDLPGDTGGLGTLQALLRAERFSLLRVYTITVEAMDAEGNTSTGDLEVEVRSKWLP